jgi:hypothetical protein
VTRSVIAVRISAPHRVGESGGPPLPVHGAGYVPPPPPVHRTTACECPHAPDPGVQIHQAGNCLSRNSPAYARDLEVVQEQLGHARIKTTTIYARVTKEDKLQAADAPAKAFRHSQQNSTSGVSRHRRAPVRAGVREQTAASF